MRRAGVASSARGLGRYDHVCCAYDESPEFEVRMLEFLAGGLESGARVMYVASGEVDELIDDLLPLDDLERRMDDGTLVVASTADTYREGAVVVPHEQLARYREATEEAVAAGFSGLRVVAEVTSLVRRPEQVEAFARWEHQAEESMTSIPFAAMCAYHRGELGAETVAAVACMHPLVTRDDACSFRLYADGSSSAVLAGEVDLSVKTLFSAALDRAEPDPVDGELLFDGRELTFIDHRGLIALRDHARRRGLGAALRTTRSGVARLVDALGLDGLRLELAA